MIDVMFLALMLLNICKYSTYISLTWQQDRKGWLLVSIFTWLPSSRDITSRRPSLLLAYSEGVRESSLQVMEQNPSVVWFYKNPELLRWSVSWFPAFDEITRFGTVHLCAHDRSYLC